MGTTPEELKLEEVKIHESLARAMGEWAHLENSLAGTLRAMLHLFGPPNAILDDMGLRLYYTPDATETRLRLVDTAITHVMPYIGYGDDLIACWGKIRGRIDRYKKTRNKMAHGQIVIAGLGGSPVRHYRLVAPIADPKRTREQFTPRQVPGMSAADIDNAARSFASITPLLDLMLGIAHQSVNVPNSWQSSLEKLQRLQKELNLSDPTQGPPPLPRFPPRH